jgi:DNA modification methylase
MSITILQGDVCDRLRELPDESVNCVVTSPPYWGLRDYGVSGQLGLEHCLAEHLAALVDVFRDVRRVLRKDGTLWLNYGDAYASAPNGRSAADTKSAGNDDRTFRDKPISTVGPIAVQRPGAEDRASHGKEAYRPGHATRTAAGGTLKPKDRMLLPARVAIALQDDGWWVRDEIIWHKPNPMPSSVKDRTTPAHEMIYMLTRSERYTYDNAAIREPFADARQGRDGSHKESERDRGGRNDGYTKPNGIDPSANGGRNKRSVWSVCPKGFKEAHFATFPPDLIRPAILAGCPEGGTVLDPFFGAGTTGLVCQQTGRNCIGIELNPAYVAIAERRLGLRCDAGVFA